MKVTINVNLQGEVLKHGSLVADLFIVQAHKLEDGSLVHLSYHIDEESAKTQLNFVKSAYKNLYSNFYVYKTLLCL